MMDKKQLRNLYLSKRQRLSLKTQKQASDKIYERLSQLIIYSNAQNLALYRSIKGEINLDKLWNLAKTQQKSCYFPAIQADKTLLFLKDNGNFVANYYNILEPNKSTMISVNQLDVIVMPLVAFDCQGNRLGMGQGYYDKTLRKSQHACLIGVGYEFQKQFSLVPDAFDVPLDIIITPENTYWV